MHAGILRMNHRSNMELDLQSLFGLLCTAVLIDWDPATPPPLSTHLGSYKRALLVSKDRRHLFVTPGMNALTPTFIALFRSNIQSPSVPVNMDPYSEMWNKRIWIIREAYDWLDDICTLFFTNHVLKIWFYTWQRTPFRNHKNQDLFEVNAGSKVPELFTGR